MKTYKVALIGCGGRGRAHMVGLQDDARLQVVALADAHREAAESVNATFGLNAPIYTDHREMLQRERPDVAVVCLWTPLHLPVYRDCAQSGVRAVLLEKPMAATWRDCLEMARLEAETKCQLTFSHQRRFAKGNRLARKLIADGLVGDIERLELFAPPNLLDCGTHTLDQAISFLGEVPAKWVLGAVDTTQILNWFDVRSEALAVGTIVFENNVRASLQVGGPDMDIWGGVRATGSKGFLEVMWGGEFKRAVVYDDPSFSVTPEADSDDEHMISYVRHAIDCLESGEEAESSCRRALRTTEVLFALYLSVQRRARVELPIPVETGNPLHEILDARTF